MDLVVLLDAQRAVAIHAPRHATVDRAATLQPHGPVPQGIRRLVFIQKGGEPRGGEFAHRADAFTDQGCGQVGAGGWGRRRRQRYKVRR